MCLKLLYNFTHLGVYKITRYGNFQHTGFKKRLWFILMALLRRNKKLL